MLILFFGKRSEDKPVICNEGYVALTFCIFNCFTSSASTLSNRIFFPSNINPFLSNPLGGSLDGGVNFCTASNGGSDFLPEGGGG